MYVAKKKGADQLRGNRSRSASLFSHMQKAGFLTTRLIFQQSHKI